MAKMSISDKDHSTIIDLFKQGKTLREIGSIYGVSGERVRQHLAKYGIKGRDGGRAYKTAAKEKAAKDKRDEKYLSKHGCTYDQFVSVCGERGNGAGSPYLLFLNQKNHAFRRKVEWKLNFWTWWNIWAESGKWEHRGRGKGGYCMCRIGDSGSYELGNVYIDTCVNNSILGRTLAYERNPEHTEVYLVIQAAGGRKAVAERLEMPAAYISQIACYGYLPKSWMEDGRAKKLSEMTCGAYSVSDLSAIAAQYSAVA